MGSEFRKFCRSLSVEHVTTPPYHPRSNRQAEMFVDTFTRALKKNNDLDMEESSNQRFVSVYRITPNPNTISGKSPAELIFLGKFDLWPTFASSEKEKNLLQLQNF